MKYYKQWIAGMCTFVSGTTCADIFHYNNVVIGERAQGLGGAYSAISDDASGVYYNPAGLAFAQSNDISGSANAFYSKKTTFKNVFEGQDFTEKSNGTFAPFFGAMQKLDKVLPGLVAGFAYYTLDTELTDENNLITNGIINSTTTYNTMRRTLNRRASTVGATLGVGYRLNPNFSLGFALTYLNTDELTQVYLMINQSSTATGTEVKMVAAQNIRELLTLYGLEPAFGMQWAFHPKLVWGLSVRKGTYASSKYERQTSVVISGKDEQFSELKSKNPVGSPPMQFRTGLAFFATQKLLFTTDVTHIDAVTGMEASYKETNKRAAVTNYALGSEYYLNANLPLRLGIFTNNDARTKPSAYQTEYVHYTGSSIFLAWAQPNSQISLGTVIQKGAGKADKIGNGQEQKVASLVYTVGFSATHSF